MSIGGSNPDQFYGDLETQTVRVGAVVSTGTGGSSAARSASIEPVGPSELANDEVAELVYFDRVLDFEVIVNGDVDNQEGTTHSAKAELGVNLDPAGSSNPQFATSDTHLGINGEAFNSDRTHLDIASLGDLVAPQNAPAGNAPGGGGLNALQRELNYRIQFGMGPFLDADDSLDFRVEASNRNSNAGVIADYYITMAWDISTVEGARPTLSPPGGMARQ